MKEKEGENLLIDLKENLSEIKKSIDIITENAEKVREYYAKMFQQKVDQFFNSVNYDKERFEQEIFYFLQKADINEEIVRLNSHIEKVQNLLESEKAVGIKLDFIMQEMNREINTIGSKTPLIEITEQVILVKTYINKIREQARNIE
jgi:uncharacterized protein (TIGR00255 family)